MTAWPATRMYPARGEPGELYHDDAGRECFVFLADCEHGRRAMVILNETHTLAEVRHRVALVALRTCADCRGAS